VRELFQDAGHPLLGDLQARRVLPRRRDPVPDADDHLGASSRVASRRRLGASDREQGVTLWMRLNGLAGEGAMSANGDLIVHAVDVHKRYGSVEVLKGISLDVRPGAGRVPDRAVGLGQDDLPALYQPPRDDRRRAHRGERPPDRLSNGPARRARHRQRAQHRQAARRDRLRLSALQPVARTSRCSTNITEAPIRVRGISRDEAVADAERLLGRVGLSDKRDVYPGKLSGGQQQRRRDRGAAPRDEPGADVVRRADERARPRDRLRCPRRHGGARTRRP